MQINLYDEIRRGVSDGEASALGMEYSAGMAKIREVALTRLASIGVLFPGLDVLAAVDAQIALAAIRSMRP